MQYSIAFQNCCVFNIIATKNLLGKSAGINVGNVEESG